MLTITATQEMTFLRRVSEKLSRPNVFVLFNRWDGSDLEDDAESVREQHLAKAARFLKADLHLDVCGEDRVFFVSAKEMLTARVKMRALPPADSEVERRSRDFVRFESNFAECISESAIRTKFEAHVVRGRDIVLQLDTWLQKITWAAKLQQTEWRARLDDRAHQLRELEAKRDDVIAKCEALVEGLGARVAADFERAYAHVVGEQLADMVDSFDFAVFTPDTTDKYKERLQEYLGREMCAQLQKACGGRLDQAYREMQQSMVREVGTVVPEGLDFRVQSLAKSPIVPSLFTAGLLDSFQEDIAFRFSLGWAALGPRLLGRSAFATVDGFVHGPLAAKAAATDVSVLAMVPATSTYVPLLTLGATLAARPTVWKLVLTMAGAWTCLYALERLTYTRAAMERRFKGQFVHHATARYQAVMLHASLNVKSHYTAGASAQLDHLRWQVDERKGMLRKEIGLLERGASRVSKIITTGDAATAHSRAVTDQLHAFCRSYLPGIYN